MRTGAFLTSLVLLLVNDHRIHGQPPLPSFENYSNSCPRRCDKDEQRPVCGSDGRTYNSQCELERVKCEGRQVEFRYRGECVVSGKKGGCLSKREEAKLSSPVDSSPFIPECKEDGSYAEVQCFSEYCWCVDVRGKALPRSSVKNGRPNCVKEAKRNTRRSPGGKKNKKGCGTEERSIMNEDLLRILKTEYYRFPQPTDNIDVNNILYNTEDKRIVQWKFSQLDLNANGYLNKSEVKDLKKMVKRIVKPKVCSKAFIKYCDLDEDGRISRTEWSVCLGVDLNNEQVDISSEATTKQEEAKLPPWSDSMPPLKTGTQQKEAISEEDEQLDCLTARNNALEIEKREPNTGQFVPECTDDGYYTQTQCHKQDTMNSLLCWCVNTRTGVPIKKTTTMKVRPDCDKRKSFKGCSLQKRQVFLDELLRFLVHEMMESRKNKSGNKLATQEQVVRWKFDLLDVNKNKMIDKREWGLFRDQWKDFQKTAKRRKLRKCWRNLPKFCDDDKDAKVAIDEWLKCTEVTRDSRGSPPPLNRQKGKQNPFIQILKSD